MPGRLTQTNITANGLTYLGTTPTGTGKVVLVVSGAFGGGTLTFGVSVDDGSENGAFHAFASPAGIVAAGEVVLECGSNMRFGVTLAGATAPDINVGASGSY